ncbi:hypothetical protein HMPREF0653_01320 [Prevotella disiens JCM 6334 = ATCC 29426]|uniref:Uncharacterized protein n=1 Tax=Prevotella disiens JCM 6334 = ATCC 29426 TaxID=1235811 RepID=A0ABN0NSB1_9BACT|nr:hypothetical protein HMPREF0653_01320 [Prevotella disiens JCM 6334 = ATCC 29426]
MHYFFLNSLQIYGNSGTYQNKDYKSLQVIQNSHIYNDYSLKSMNKPLEEKMSVIPMDKGRVELSFFYWTAIILNKKL